MSSGVFTDSRGGIEFARLLAGFRLERGFSQERLADRSGMSVRAIRDLERGRVDRPRRSSIAVLADALALTDAERAAVEQAVVDADRRADERAQASSPPRGPYDDLAAVALPMVRSLRLLASIARVAALSRRGLAERVIASTVLIASTMLLAGASVGLEAERDAPGANITSFGDAMWWALTTVTTVGYGDRYPVTAEGRVVGGVLMVVGIATMGAVTTGIASQLMNPRRSAEPQPADERVRQLEAQIAHLTAQLDSARATSPR